MKLIGFHSGRSGFHILLLALFLAMGHAHAEKWVVVVDTSNPMKTISYGDFKKLCLSIKKHWPDGQAVKLSVPGLKSPEMVKILSSIYKMNLQKYNAYWLKKVFCGEAQAPIVTTTGKAAIEFIKANRGAVGFILDADLTEAVKILQVQGLEL